MAESTEPIPRLFTYEEASALLPELRGLLADLQAATAALQDLQHDLDEGQGMRARLNGHAGPDPHLDELTRKAEEAQQRVIQAVHGIEARGCELKDPRRGMVDFRTVRDGRVVYFCWLLEEPEIMFWHELEGGFAGRHRL